MKHYIALVHQDDGSAYGVQFPDVAGCFSASDTLDDLLKNATEALSLHLEGEELPQARPLAELQADPTIQEELKDGAFLLAVPHVSFEGRTVKANITLDAGTLNAIDTMASQRGMSRSAFIATLAHQEFKA